MVLPKMYGVGQMAKWMLVEKVSAMRHVAETPITFAVVIKQLALFKSELNVDHAKLMGGIIDQLTETAGAVAGRYN